MDHQPILFKKKKSSAARLNHRSPLPSPPSTSNPDSSGQSHPTFSTDASDGNIVLSRLPKNSLRNKSIAPVSTLTKQAALKSASPHHPLHPTRSSSDSHTRKLRRPHILGGSDDQAVLPSPPSPSSPDDLRPSYSVAHLNQLRALNLSGPTPSHVHHSFDSLTNLKFGQSSSPNDPIHTAQLSSVIIPSSDLINSAKERRSQARKAAISQPPLDVLSASLSSAENFISLSAQPSSLMSLGPAKKGESRLVREEDELGQGDDAHAEYTGAKEKVPLGRDAGLRAEAERKAAMQSMILHTEAEMDEGNEEEMAWEADQIRRGGIGSLSERTTTQPDTRSHEPAPVPLQCPLPSLPSVTSRLAESLRLAQESVSQQEQAIEQHAAQHKALEKQELELRQEVAQQVERATFFGELQSFITDMNRFLATKWSSLEQVEQDLLSILKEKSQIVFDRRFADLSDDLVLFKSGKTGVTRPSFDTKPEQSLSEDVAQGAEGQVDELGRSRPELNISSQAAPRQLRRDERIRRRQRRKTACNALGPLPEEEEKAQEGYSTDDSLSPADSSDLLMASKSLVSSCEDLLKDTLNPLFLSPTSQNSLSDRFLSWQSKFPEDYANAFGNLALVQAWEFWTRMEMAGGLNLWGFKNWVSCGEEDGSGMENWKWMKGLESFDHSSSPSRVGEAAQQEQDSVVAVMMTTVVVPFLVPIIEASYDPYSTRATTKGLQLVEQVSYVLSTQGNPTFDRLVISFLERIGKCVYEVQYLVLIGKDEEDEKGEELKRGLVNGQVGVPGIEARNRFLNKCFKLFRQAVRWNRYARSTELLITLPAGGQYGGEGERKVKVSLRTLLARELVQKVMVPVLIAGWETGGQVVAQKVLEVCPDEILEGEVVRCLQLGPQQES